MNLPCDYPTAIALLDETGAIANDRFFAVGCLKLAEPSILVRSLQRLRDQVRWYEELHFHTLTRSVLPLCMKVVELAASTVDARFSCFVTDREIADPVVRFGSPWRAYEKLATQLLVGSIRPNELVCVLADYFTTPTHIEFDKNVRTEVNRRFGHCTVPAMCRLDSRSADSLQVVDLLTSAVMFEFRAAAGLAGKSSPKAQLARHVRDCYEVKTFLDLPIVNERLNVRMYHGRKGP